VHLSAFASRIHFVKRKTPATALLFTFQLAMSSDSSPSSTESTDMFIYVLKLEKFKWYIGRSSNVNGRYQQHATGNGAEWTKLFKPMSMLPHPKIETSPHDEDNLTLEYMCQYGIENVRGASFTKLVFSADELTSLQQRVRDHLRLCRGCALPGHFIANCSQSKSNYPLPVIKNSYMGCLRCGRDTHITQKCFASIDVFGNMMHK